jgi:hypothetical protein
MCGERKNRGVGGGRKTGGWAADGRLSGCATSARPLRLRRMRGLSVCEERGTRARAANGNAGVELVGGAAGGADKVQLGVLFCLVEDCVALDGSSDGVGESGPEIGGQQIRIEAEIFASRHVKK